MISSVFMVRVLTKTSLRALMGSFSISISNGDYAIALLQNFLILGRVPVLASDDSHLGLTCFRGLASVSVFSRLTLTAELRVPPSPVSLRAYLDASRNNLRRTYLPYVGSLAEQWVSEE